MLEHKETFTVGSDLDRVWSHVHDMANWAASVPGYESFEIIDDETSRWTLKVSLGALTRTIRAKVTVTEWVEPKRVAFVFQGETEPITGSGSFDAEPGEQAGTTSIDIGLTVSGSGPMAPAMEAMSRPVLPRLGCMFVEALRRDIEGVTASTPKRTAWAKVRAVLAGIARILTLRKRRSSGRGR